MRIAMFSALRGRTESTEPLWESSEEEEEWPPKEFLHADRLQPSEPTQEKSKTIKLLRQHPKKWRDQQENEGLGLRMQFEVK